MRPECKKARLTKLIESLTFVSKLECLSLSVSVSVSVSVRLSVSLSVSLVTESLGSFKPNFMHTLKHLHRMDCDGILLGRVTDSEVFE